MSTYTPIASVTLSSAQSSVTFSGIPQTYTDLVLVGNIDATDYTSVWLQFNGDTASNYSRTILVGDGTSATSERTSNGSNMAIGTANTEWGVSIFNVMNYSNSTTYKTAIARGNNNSQTRAGVGLWRNTAAVTSLTVGISSADFASGTTFNLYGVANASITNVAKATGGDSVYTDGTYWYHIFRSSGTFTPTQALTADYLVVAGGGGGSFGGGGAGGYRTSIGGSGLSCTTQAYTVTVGAGGTGRLTGTRNSTAGSNSVFSSITASGGGYGGGNTGNAGNGGNGGSGGGGGHGSGSGGGPVSPANGGTGNSGSYSPVEGYGGGTGRLPNNYGGGGGGGSSAVGGDASNTTGGAGGAGTSNSISGTSVTYAGGGGGAYNGAAGSGGGGAGKANGEPADAGTANTGGGGGGTNADSFTGGAGGSGIVIVRYAA